MFTEGDDTDSTSSEEPRNYHEASSRNSENSGISSNLRRMIEDGIKDWQSFKGTHAKSYKNENVENERMLAFLMAKERKFGSVFLLPAYDLCVNGTIL